MDFGEMGASSAGVKQRGGGGERERERENDGRNRGLVKLSLAVKLVVKTKQI